MHDVEGLLLIELKDYCFGLPLEDYETSFKTFGQLLPIEDVSLQKSHQWSSLSFTSIKKRHSIIYQLEYLKNIGKTTRGTVSRYSCL